MSENPPTIRYNNPGAMYPGPSARRFGGKAVQVIGGGHLIAVFPDPVSGAAAMFDLLHRSYTGMPLADAIEKWSGGNDVDTYVRRVVAMAKIKPREDLTKEMIETPEKAIPLARAMAKHEAGREYPMDDAEWAEAHARALPKTTTAVSGQRSPFDLAKTFIGTREVRGNRDNPEIMRWYVDAGHPEVEHDETPNCAAFVCSMLSRTGCKNPKTLLARDFLKYGEECEPEEGCIVVISRGSSGWEGHVGFLSEPDDGSGSIRMLGANQGDEVNIMRVDSDRVLGYRRPAPEKRGVFETVSKSRTLKTQINALLTTILSAAALVWNWLYSAAGAVADAASGAVDKSEQVVSTGSRLAALLNVNWPAAAGVAITGACLIYAIARGLSERRVK